MAFNGSGTFSLVAGNPVVTGTTISSTWANNTLSDIANNGLTNCITKNGQTTTTASIGFAAGISVTGTAAVTGTVTASTSVVTPLVGTIAAVDLVFQAGNLSWWKIGSSSSHLTPILDNGSDFGQAANRIRNVFTPIIDSGTTGSLSLKTNNGQLGFAVVNNAGSNVVNLAALPNTTGLGPFLFVQGETNTPLNIQANGTGSVNILTNGGGTAVTQLQILHTASATRNITITGSNGGNPTISTTGGNLAITPSVVIAGTTVTVGTNPSGQAGYNVPYTSGLTTRNGANSGDMSLISAVTVNSVQDTVSLGPTTAGVIIRARSGGSAPTTSDIAPSTFCVWRDTGGATTKLYYNNGGSLQSVALA